MHAKCKRVNYMGKKIQEHNITLSATVHLHLLPGLQPFRIQCLACNKSTTVTNQLQQDVLQQVNLTNTALYSTNCITLILLYGIFYHFDQLCDLLLVSHMCKPVKLMMVTLALGVVLCCTALGNLNTSGFGLK